MAPRFGVLEVDPETAVEVMTNLPVSIVRVNVWVALGFTPLLALMQNVVVPTGEADCWRWWPSHCRCR